ncbi:MAG: right-handed parallel beta-helix repeat-containing protein [Thermoplasmata archaeon]|nr:MAG: right-handed parallel beta-helix repeat-containing protein [Thermoplasmata archaeon]
MGRWATATALLALALIALALMLATAPAGAQTISTDTEYRDENLVFTEDVEVTGGAKLTLKGCDITFRPPGTLPLYLRVVSGSLVITDTDLVGEGAGFIVLSAGDATIRNVTASGLGAEANSSLTARGLPLAAQGGFMFYNSKVSVFNLDISGAPATALYAEDCDLDIFSLGTRDACAAYTGTDQCAAVAITYMGHPSARSDQRTAVINGSKIQTSYNHGLLVAAAATGYDVNVTVLGTEISTSAASGLVVYEVNSHGVFNVMGDTDDIHHSGHDGVLWVRKSASGTHATLDLKQTRIYSITGTAFRVIGTNSRGSATLVLDSCTVTDTTGHGTWVTTTGCTQSLNVTLVDSVFDSPGGSGLFFTTEADGMTSEYHMKLVGTTLDSAGSYGIYTKLSQSYALFNLTLIDSEVINSGADGIRMEYSLSYFSYLEAPSVTSNLTVEDSLIADNEGYGIYDTRYLRSYYSWAQKKATLHAAVNVLGSTIRNHTRSAVAITPTAQLYYATYTSEGFVTDSTFINNSGHGYYEKVDSITQANGGTTRVGWHFTGSTFRDLTHSGVYIEVRRADGAMILFNVHNCTFADLGYHGAMLYASSSTYIGKVLARLEDCSMTDLGGHAYYLWPGRPGTTGDDQRVFLRRVRAHNTTGFHVLLDGYSSTEDYYRLTLEELNVTQTRGDAIELYVHPYQSARMDTTLKDIYVRNTNGTALSLTFTSDRGQPLWGQLTGENITLLDQQVGGLLLYEHTGSITDLTIKGSMDFDMHKVDNRLPPDETGILELHSASMDRKKVKVVGDGSLWVFNALSVKVEWQNGMAALGAGVQVQDRSFQVVAVGHVEGEHGMDPVELLAYILDSQEFRSRSPFIVNITFLDLEQTGVCSLDEPSTVRIVVHDRVAPSVVILEPDDGASQRASYFELRGSAFDAHAGLHMIRYRLDGGEWVDIGAASPFRTTVQDVAPGEHTLEVDVFDRAGNLASELVRIEIDNQPPRLVVVSPEGDLLTRDPSLVVRGETEDGASVSINGEEVETLHGLFIAEVGLQEGPNTITVVSMDRLSNVATVRFIATLDTVEPFLDVQSHDDGDWVSTTSVTIAGIVEAGCTLTVDGHDVVIDDQNFTATALLKLGDNMVTFRAVDPAGNVFTQVINLYVSTDEPWLNLESPLDGGVYAQHEVRVLGTVQPGSSVTLNGRAVTIKQGLVDELLILPEGMSTIIIEVIDAADNIHTRTVQVSVDTVDPVLTLDPLPERTNDAQLTVTGTAEGATALFLGDALVEIGPDGEFSANVTLVEGNNVLELVCRDGVGHEDSASVTVVLDSTAPFLRLTLPGLTDDGNGTWFSDSKKVTVQVVSEPGASITLNGVYILVGEDGTANVDITLKGNGEPTIVNVLIVDDLGNSEELTYNIVYEGEDDEGPAIEWLSLISTIVIMALLVTMVVLVARYKALVKKMSQRRRGPPRRRNGGPRGPPRNGGNGNGGGPA